MAKIWSSLFGGGGGGQPEERLSLTDYANQYFTYKNNGYPVYPSGGYAKDVESIEHDFESYVADAYKSNGVVFAAMVARSRLFTQARFQWQKMNKGRPGDLFGTPELSVLEEPWESAGTIDLLNRAITHADLSGNHYAVREGNGRIRVLRPDWVDVIHTAPPEEAVESDIAGWRYRPGGTNDRSLWKYYVAGDERFAHWMPTLDPTAQFRGMSWLTPVIREIVADKAATKHKAKFFDNAATPALAISFKETVTAEQFKTFMELMKEKHEGVDNAYGTLYVGGGADITPLTYDMRQLDFKTTQGAGETRIAMAARIHPVILGASEGMQGASLNAGNFKAAKDAWADGEMRPLWASLCQAYTPLLRIPKGARLWYDDRDIAFLREDLVQKAQVMKEEAQSITRLVQDGFTWESARDAIQNGGDWTLLKHTGLFSVQLQPPFPNGVPSATGGTPIAGAPQGAKPTPLQNKVAKAAKNGTSPTPTTGTPGKAGTGAKRDGTEAGPEEGRSGQEEGRSEEA